MKNADCKSQIDRAADCRWPTVSPLPRRIARPSTFFRHSSFGIRYWLFAPTTDFPPP
jgi:hypothetical protein